MQFELQKEEDLASTRPLADCLLEFGYSASDSWRNLRKFRQGHLYCSCTTATCSLSRLGMKPEFERRLEFIHVCQLEVGASILGVNRRTLPPGVQFKLDLFCLTQTCMLDTSPA